MKKYSIFLMFITAMIFTSCTKDKQSDILQVSSQPVNQWAIDGIPVGGNVSPSNEAVLIKTTSVVSEYKSQPLVSLVINGGGLNTTDWLDTNNVGRADNWSSQFLVTPNDYANVWYYTYSNGFTSKAQGIHGHGTHPMTSRPDIYNNSFKFEYGRTYKIRFKYRSSTQLRLGWTNEFYPAVKEGNAVYVESKFTCTFNNVPFLIYSVGGNYNDWFEVDEINVVIVK